MILLTKMRVRLNTYSYLFIRVENIRVTTLNILLHHFTSRYPKVVIKKMHSICNEKLNEKISIRLIRATNFAKNIHKLSSGDWTHARCGKPTTKYSTAKHLLTPPLFKITSLKSSDNSLKLILQLQYIGR